RRSSRMGGGLVASIRQTPAGVLPWRALRSPDMWSLAPSLAVVGPQGRMGAWWGLSPSLSFLGGVEIQPPALPRLRPLAFAEGFAHRDQLLEVVLAEAVAVLARLGPRHPRLDADAVE